MAWLLWCIALLLSSTFASPVLTPSEAICAICPTICPTSYLAPREVAFPATTCPASDASPVFNTRYRSTIEILWSCLAIIFASTWICVHPNVTGYNTTKWQKLKKRVILFALAVFAPELLAVFAFFQWKGCRELHKAFRDKAIELNISLDLDTKDPPLPTQAPKTSPSPHNFSGDTQSEPLIPRSDVAPQKETVFMHILHYPKRGLRFLACAMSLYQVDPRETAWTLTHAHFVQMGGIVFKDPKSGDVGFKKPRFGNYGKYYWTDEDIKNFFALRLTEAAISDKSKGSALAKTLVIMQVLWFVVQTVARALEGLPITHLEVVCLAFTLFNIGMYTCWWDKPVDVECPLEVEGEPGEDSGLDMEWSDLFVALVGGLDSIPVGRWAYSPETKLYPSLYCYHKDLGRDLFLDKYFSNDGVEGIGGAFTWALSFTSATFGTLHAIGWSLPSPSPAEHMLWRISCLVLMCYPLVPLVILPFAKLLKDHAPEWVFVVYSLGMAFISFLGAIAYIGARFILLVLPFLELRELPPLAHQTISWSNFLPHI